MGADAIRNSIYSPYDITETQAQVPTGILAPKFGIDDVYCPHCPQGVGLIKYGQISNPSPGTRVEIVRGASAFDISAFYSAEARNLMMEGTLVFASEARELRRTGQATHLVVGDDGRPIGVFQWDAAAQSTIVRSGNLVAGASLPTAALYALSASSDIAFAAAVVDGKTSLFSLDLHGPSGWLPWSAPSFEPDVVRGLTASREGFYFLDEHAGMLRIFLLSAEGSSSELIHWTKPEWVTQASVGAGYLRGVVVALSGGGAHQILLFDVDAGRVLEVRSASGTGHVGAIRSGRGGLLYIVPDSGQAVEATSFVSTRQYRSCDVARVHAGISYGSSTVVSNGEVSYDAPRSFIVPDSLEVLVGSAADQEATVLFDDVKCIYNGATVAHPSTPQQIDAGRKYYFQSCTNASASGAQITASKISVHVQGGDSQLPSTEVVATAIESGDSVSTFGSLQSKCQ